MSDLRFERLGPQAQLLGSFDFREHQPQSLSVPAGSTLFVRRADAVAALRLLGAWDVDGRSIGFTLQNDGLAWRVLRLTATHASERTSKRASLAMWAWAGEGLADDSAFARQRQKILASPATASLQGARLQAERGELALELDVERGLRVLRRGHAELPDSAWSVNGQAWQP